MLANESFAWIVDDQTNMHLAALIAASPGPKGLDAREYHHLQQHALTELVAALQGYAQAGEAMRAAVEAMTDLDEPEDTEHRD